MPSAGGCRSAWRRPTSLGAEDVWGVSIGLDNLLSGIIGAVLVVAYTEVRDARRRVSEAAGLAKLLADEVSRNKAAVVLRRLPEDQGGQEVLIARGDNPPAIDAWLEVRARLAQLLHRREDFDAISDYYQNWHKLEQRIRPHVPSSSAKEPE